MRARAIAMAITPVVAAVVGCVIPAMTTYEAAGAVADPTAFELRLAMRRLWSEHVFWTRDYVIAALADHPSAPAVATRLLRNQDEIGDAIEPYYGIAAGDSLGRLLKQHIQIAVDLIGAAKSGDVARRMDADRRWQANAGDIATFLAAANPNWPRQALLDMLTEHLALTTHEVAARMEGRWTDDTAVFDKVHVQSMAMADALTDGIVKQFPARF